MNKIYLIRHSTSVGNEDNIIQGNIDYSLSKKGIELLNNFDYTRIKKIKNIYSSPCKRTLETSQIIKSKLNVNCDIIIDYDIIEKQAGILNGKSKDYLKKYKKKYLDIYLDRGDYDKIPDGENWEYTQARVLSFLEKYIDKHEECDLVVTHAAFMRMLINTITFEYRNEPKKLPNACLYIIDDPLKKILVEKYEIAKASSVYKITTYDNNYILKRINRKLTQYDYSINKLLKTLSKHIDVPRPIYMSNKSDYSIKIYGYIEGNHILGNINAADKKKLIKAVYKLTILLKKNSEGDIYDNFEKRDIVSDMFSMKKELKEEKYIKIVDNLINDGELNNYLNIAKYVLVHNDLHRYNILFEYQKIAFLDFDGLKLCPELLQPASFIATCFLLEDNSIEIENILKCWPDKINMNIVKKLILYRLLYGLSFFDKISNCNKTDKEIRKKYINAIERMI